jgi:hypothetical protein
LNAGPIAARQSPYKALWAPTPHSASRQFSGSGIKDLRDAAQVMGQQIHFFEVSSESDLDAAFAALVRRRIGGFVSCASSTPVRYSSMARDGGFENLRRY